MIIIIIIIILNSYFHLSINTKNYFAVDEIVINLSSFVQCDIFNITFKMNSQQFNNSSIGALLHCLY